MPQPLSDIADRIDLLKMTLGLFAPEEPGPIAVEIVGLAEEIFEHFLVARGETAAADITGERLPALHSAVVFGEPSFATLAGSCRQVLELRAQVIADPEDEKTAERLLLAATLVGGIYSAVTGRMAAGGAGSPQR